MISGISDEEQMRSLAQHAFDKYDEDKSGTLDIMELAEVLIHLLPLQNSDFNEDQWVDLIKRVYQQNDADSDGHIDFDEFVKLYTKVLASDELKSNRELVARAIQKEHFLATMFKKRNCYR